MRLKKLSLGIGSIALFGCDFSERVEVKIDSIQLDNNASVFILENETGGWESRVLSINFEKFGDGEDNFDYVWRVEDSLTNRVTNVFQDILAYPANFTPNTSGIYTVTVRVNDNSSKTNDEASIKLYAAKNITQTSNEEIINPFAFALTTTDDKNTCDNLFNVYTAQSTNVGSNNVIYENSYTIIDRLDENYCQIDTDQLPNHAMNDSDESFDIEVSYDIGNSRRGARKVFSIPRNPTMSGEGSLTELNPDFVPAIMLNGVVFNPLSEGCYGIASTYSNGDMDEEGEEQYGCNSANEWRYNFNYANNTHLKQDSFYGHVTSDGVYQYHRLADSFFELCINNPEMASQVIGYAADGFPIYGCLVDESNSDKGRLARSGYALRSGERSSEELSSRPNVKSSEYDGQFISDYGHRSEDESSNDTNAYDLDRCNGMKFYENDESSYRYYMTPDFPYGPYCLVGAKDESFNKDNATNEETSPSDE